MSGMAIDCGDVTAMQTCRAYRAGVPLHSGARALFPDMKL